MKKLKILQNKIKIRNKMVINKNNKHKEKKT
jgi:hypothetical protein